MRQQTALYTLIAVAIGVFLWTSLSFNFYQDDAYITYRYVANYLHGQGLVFNIGERIEGYTNFGWLIYLLLCGVLGLNYIVLSKLTGVFLGTTVVFITYLIAEHCLGKGDRWAPVAACLLVGFNLSLAYWSQAGLETAAFVFLAALGLYLFLLRHWLLIAVLTFAVLIRPEGALLAGLFMLIELIVHRRRPLFSIICILAAFVFSLPLVGFKLAYYGSILPNSFYAKTGFDLGQVLAGVEYSARFFGHYQFFGVALVLLPLFWRRLSRPARSVWLFALLYALYVVLIGGDVLKVHRFFLPDLLPLAVCVAMLLNTLLARFKPWLNRSVIAIFTVGLVVATLLVPRGFIERYETLEKVLVDKMAYLAARLKQTGPREFTAATSTIGSFSYQLMGYRVIDMLGLTDSTIARHPEPDLGGMESTWREQKYNSSYLLSEAPDYIIFSTGLKPSAPAERALMTYPQFLDCYRGASYYYQPLGSQAVNPMAATFRKRREPEPPFVPVYPIEFVNNYNRGTNAFNAGRYRDADRYFREALRMGGDPPYVYLLFRMAMNDFQLGELDRGEALQNEILRIDSTVTEVQADLYVYEYTIGNLEKAAIHRRWLDSLSPWLGRRYDSLAQVRAAEWQRHQADSPEPD